MNWPHLSTTWPELTFEHCPVDERSGNLSGCLIIRPPAGKAVHLGLSRRIVAADDLLTALKAFLRAPTLAAYGAGSSSMLVQDFNLRAAEAAIAKAEGRS